MGSSDKMSDNGEANMEITPSSDKYGGEFGALVTLMPTVLLVIVGFVMELSAAFGVIDQENTQYFLLFLYAVGLLGMLGMLILHGCNCLTTDGHSPGVAFTRSGIYVLGSGAMIFQGIALYGTSLTLGTCHYYLTFAVELCAMLFTGMQVFILIKFQRIRINKNALATLFSRCVLAHLVASNLCLWLMTIIEESIHEIGHDDHSDESDHGPTNDTNHTSSEYSDESACVPEEDLVELIIPYTYPLLIEFCILAGCLFITTWERCGLKTPLLDHPPTTVSRPVDDGLVRPIHHGGKADRLVQHHNSGVGMLMGWLVILATVIFVVICLYNFYVQSEYTRDFSLMVYGYNMALSILLLLAVSTALCTMASLKSGEPHGDEDETKQEKRDQTILIVTFIALACYKVFALIAAITEGQIGIILDGVFSSIGALALTIFLNYYIPRKSLAYPEQRAFKPGRQSLEFMRCLNVALWLSNTFLLKATSAKRPMERTYGDLVWAIVSNIVQPLTILFHFHAMMCISDAIYRVHTWHEEPQEIKKANGSKPPSMLPSDNHADNGGFRL